MAWLKMQVEGKAQEIASCAVGDTHSKNQKETHVVEIDHLVTRDMACAFETVQEVLDLMEVTRALEGSCIKFKNKELAWRTA